MPDKTPASPPLRILVRSPNWLGDAVMAIPAIKNIAARLDSETFCIICKKGLGDLFRRYDFVDEVVEFAPNDSGKAHKNLYGKKFDTVFLFTNSFHSAWDARKTGARTIIGFKGAFRNILLSQKLEKPRNAHMADYYMAISPAMPESSPRPTADFPLLAEEKEFASRLNSIEGAIGVTLGARYGPAKCWPPENLAAFIKLVIEKTGTNIVLFGTDAESSQAMERERAQPDRIKNLAGKTSIGQMAAVMKRCRAVVANDSGPLHIAAALGVKTIALFGPTDPNRTAPLAENVRVIYNDADCAPCFKRECPSDFQCMNMKDITPEAVFEEINKIIPE